MTVIKLIALLVIALVAPVMTSAFCFAQTMQSQTCKLIPPHALDTIPTSVEFYQYDSAPLGRREPIIFIHGLLGEFHPFFRWQQLAQYLNQDQRFRNRYKIYLARYNTQSSRNDLTQAFIAAFHEFNRGHVITIVTISMSGAIVRDAMKDVTVNESIAKVLTLGAFFHGSPLFCSEWMKETLRETHFSPLTKEERVLAYNLYFSRHKNLLTDFKWENANELELVPKF
jgi:triacylglycerol esterase/lipase EstA (alpha/beta hydrolase family)